MAKCETCGWPSKDGLCSPPTYEQVMRQVFRPRMTDAEANRVVLPKLGVLTLAERMARWQRQAERETFACQADAVERYLEAMGQAGCCTIHRPCERHRRCFEQREPQVVRERKAKSVVDELLDEIVGS